MALFRNTLKKLLSSSEATIINLPCLHTRKCNYVNVYMKWKKDSYYDSIPHILYSPFLKPITSLTNIISQYPNACIPVSAVSKRGLELDVPVKVARFLRLYPSIFEEFVGPQYNHPWFRLTPQALALHEEERAVYCDRKKDIWMRLKKLILMSRGRVLPLRMEDGEKGLGVVSDERVLSVMEMNAMEKGTRDDEEGSIEAIEFPLYPSKGLRLKRKIENWIDEFQKAPYVSPYEDSSNLDPTSDSSEKRVVGVLHELLSLFVEHSAERKKLLCLRKFLGLPQKFYKAFERHPHIFYLSLRNKTCTAILKQAYNQNSGIEVHPLLRVRKKYVKLMKESEVILKNRRMKTRGVRHEDVGLDLDLDSVERETQN
ncbi:Protein ROOT PRIMORDIUM defective 1 [Vitis vinifera]|uniref:Protein ROOT PRIMORDIUM defective 1 n=1 Tax=Vitis vinifera TaxID=29760 RepID=A0A438CWE1_VITVI|nr:Protein ROOT PRIMORDIUM defective 1 [Vitis vinifera]